MTKKTNEVKAEINTLESQGKALNTKWKRIVKAEKRQIIEFDLPLGKLLIDLSAEGNGRISTARLKECSVHNIPKQRRSEAKQLAELWDNLQDYLPRFTSTSAMLKAYKDDNKTPVEPKGSETPEQPEPKGSDKSDVGQPTSGERSADQKSSALDIALLVLEQCELHGVELQDVLGELNPRVKSKVAA